MTAGGGRRRTRRRGRALDSKKQERWARGKRRSVLWIPSPLSTLVMGNRLTWRLVSALPAQSTPALTRELKACPSVNMSKKIGETGLRRRSVPRILPRLCATSLYFENRGYDCLGPHVSHGTVTNRCFGKCQTRRYGIHAGHLVAFTVIKCCHMSTGGTALPL
jgi:hypothetical protein